MKKNRRSIISPKKKRASGQMDGPSLTHFLFKPEKRDPNAPVIVPESPTFSTCPSTTLASVSNQTSVLETPDMEDSNSYGNVSNLNKEVVRKNPKKTLGVSCPEVTNSDNSADDSQVFDVTPDLNLRKKNKLRDILESEHSSTDCGGAQDKRMTCSLAPGCVENERPRKQTFDNEVLSSSLGRTRRKSLAHIILPSDLNDPDHLSTKLNLIKQLEESSKTLHTPPRKDKRQPKCLVNSLATCHHQGQSRQYSASPNVLQKHIPNTVAKPSASILHRSIIKLPVKKEREVASGTCNCGRERDATIHFDSEDVLLTPVYSRNLLVHHAVSDKSKNMSSDVKSLEGLVEGIKKNDSSIVKDDCGESQQTCDPSPDPSTVLQGVVAYVEVRMEGDNRSGVIKDQLRALGASVLDRLNQSVTHVIFKDGSKSVFMRARKRRLHLLSSLWVEECRVKLCRVSEALYPSSSIEHYTNSFIPGKLRKMRSMQPKEFSEDEQLANERARRRRLKLSDSPSLKTSSDPIPRPLFFTPQHCSTSSISEDIDSPLFGISHLLTPNRRRSASSTSSEEAQEDKGATDDTNYNTPLAKRMYDRFVSPKSESGLKARKGSVGRKRNSEIEKSVENAHPSSGTEERIRAGTSIAETKNMEFQMSVGAGSSRTKDPSTSEQSLERIEEMASLRLSSDAESHFSHENVELPVRLDCAQTEHGAIYDSDPTEKKRNNAEMFPRRSSRRLLATKLLASRLNDNDLVENNESSSNSDSVTGLSENSRQLLDNSSSSAGQNMEFSHEPGTGNGITSPGKAHRRKRKSNDFEESIGASVLTKTKQMGKVIKGSSSCETQICTRERGNSMPASQLSQGSYSQSQRHRLLCIDSVEPSQELVVPVTPDDSKRKSAGAYAQLMVVESRTQRKAVKALKDISGSLPLPRSCPLKHSTRSRPGSSTTEDTEPSTKTGDGESATESTHRQPKRTRTQQLRKSLRRSIRGSQSEAFSSGEESVFGEATITPLPRPRRSTDEFRLEGDLIPKGKKNKKNLPGRNSICICLTSFHSKDKQTVVQIIKKLGGGKMCEEVGEETSHVVCGEERRTLSFLMGIARGCWILSDVWLYQSLEMNAWAPEEPFEMFQYAPASKICREQRMSQGAAYHQTLFSAAGSICVLEGCSPPAGALRNLLSLCGANVVQSVRCANLVVGRKLQNSQQRSTSQPTLVSEKWVLDCVVHHKIHPTHTYHPTPENSSS